MAIFYDTQIDGNLNVSNELQVGDRNVMDEIDELNSNLEKLTAEVILWSGDYMYTGTVSLLDDVFKYKYVVFMNDNSIYYKIPIIQNMENAYDCSSSYIGNQMFQTWSLTVSDISSYSMTIFSMYITHTFTSTHPDVSYKKINKIIGIR